VWWWGKKVVVMKMSSSILNTKKELERPNEPKQKD